MSFHTIYGYHTVRNFLLDQPFRVKNFWMVLPAKGKPLSSKKRLLTTLAEKNNLLVQPIRASRLDQLTGSLYHQGIALEITVEPGLSIETFWEKRKKGISQPLLMPLLTYIADPQNLGACFRTALAASADAVCLTKKQSAPLNAAARKAGSGACEHLPYIFVTAPLKLINFLHQQGVTSVAMVADPEATPIYEQDLTQPSLILIGSEEKGLSKELVAHCQARCTIPMNREAQSLNASAATAIALFEAVRQRRALDAKKPRGSVE